MRDFRDAKAMAQSLRSSADAKGLKLTHSECLEITARMLGAKDWNVLAAAIEGDPAPAPESPGRRAADRWSGPLLLVRDIVLFPKHTAPIYFARDFSKLAAADAGRGELEVLVVAQKNESEERPGREDIYDVGTVADVLDMTPFTPVGAAPNSALKLTLHGRQRARLLDIVDRGDGLSARAQIIATEVADTPAATEQVRAAFRAFRTIVGTPNFHGLSPERQSRLIDRTEGIARPDVLADVIAQYAPGSVAEKQLLLESLDPMARLASAVALLSRASASTVQEGRGACVLRPRVERRAEK